MPRQRFLSRMDSFQPLLVGLVLVALILGWQGLPAVSSQGMMIRSSLIEGDVPVTSVDPRWHRIPPMVLPLSGQVITRPVWTAPSTRSLQVRSAHNGKEIAFLLEWNDNTRNERLTPGKFRDGVAIGLPMGEAPAFFCMGQIDHYINIWHWKSDWQRDVDQCKARGRKWGGKGPRIFKPCIFRKSSVEELLGGGFSTLTTKKRQGNVQGTATWDRGVWRVVMRRDFGSPDPVNDARLEPGRLQTISFAVWNGEHQERNGQKAISPWFLLVIDPAT